MSDSKKTKKYVKRLWLRLVLAARLALARLDRWLDSWLTPRLDHFLDIWLMPKLERLFARLKLHKLPRRRIIVRLCGAFGLALLIGFGAGIVHFALTPSHKDETRQGVLAPQDITPPKIMGVEGVTVMVKEMPPETISATPIYAPVAEGASRPEGFAMDLGAALSFAELSARFERIATMNDPAAFKRLDPRAILRDTVTGLEARLLVGPFDSGEDADKACKVIKLPEGISCKSVVFDGELIDRE